MNLSDSIIYDLCRRRGQRKKFRGTLSFKKERHVLWTDDVSSRLLATSMDMSTFQREGAGGHNQQRLNRLFA
jgi:hypothetical protein